jgi:hypothetical protein
MVFDDFRHYQISDFKAQFERFIAVLGGLVVEQWPVPRTVFRPSQLRVILDNVSHYIHSSLLNSTAE